MSSRRRLHGQGQAGVSEERTPWRFTYKRLVEQSVDALRGSEFGAASAVVVDLACEMKEVDYVRSQDPVEASTVVISDVVSTLWSATLTRHGIAGFAERASAQLIRWERPYGWTRMGFGSVSNKESLPAEVAGRLLPIPDAWNDFGEQLLDRLVEHPALSGPEAVFGRSRGTRSFRRSREMSSDGVPAVTVGLLLESQGVAGSQC